MCVPWKIFLLRPFRQISKGCSILFRNELLVKFITVQCSSSVGDKFPKFHTLAAQSLEGGENNEQRRGPIFLLSPSESF